MTIADYATRYRAGESLLTLSLDAGGSQKDMRDALAFAGVEIRPGVGASGLDRALHMPATASTGRGRDPDARIVRPSVARWLR